MRSVITPCLAAVYCLVGILVLAGQVIVEPIALKNIIAQIECPDGGDAHVIVVFMGIFVLCSLLQNAGKMTTSIIQQFVAAWRIRKLSGLMYSKLVSRGEMDEKGSEPEMLVKRIMRDVETVIVFRTRLLMEIPILFIGLITAIATMLFGTLSAFGINGLVLQKGNWLLTLIVIALLPLQFVFMAFNRRMMSLEQRQADAQEKECFIATESLRGIADVRLNNGLRFVSDRIRNCLAVAFRERFRYGSLTVAVRSISNMTWAFSQAATLAVSVWLIFKGAFTFSDYVAFSAVSGVFNLFAMGIVEIGLEWQKMVQPNIRLRHVRGIKGVDNDGLTQEAIRGNIRLDNVSLNGIVHGLNLNIREGEHVAITGPSGCGKTTMLNMIARQRRCSSGRILLNEIDTRSIDAVSYACNVVLVPQRPFIFDASVRENILMGLEKIDEKVLLSVVKDVGLAEYLSGIDQNISVALDKNVTSGAKNISGGQIARIALARALIRSPSILLLDETTAAIDEVSERQISTMLHKRMIGKTVLAVSHKKGFTGTFSRILLMRNGTIVEEKLNNLNTEGDMLKL